MKKTLQELCGIPSKMEFEVADQPPEYGAVEKNAEYLFRPDLVRHMVIFWTMAKKRAAMLVGPPGSGKTTIVEQWHERLGVPLMTFTGHKKAAVEDLFGQFLPNDQGGLVWHDGPLVLAARFGWSVLINELNAMPPEVTIAMNDIMQAGTRVVIPQTGEIIQPLPGFRIFATMNPPGRDAVRYKGRQAIDPSTRERFFWIEVPYASTDEEERIVEKAFMLTGGIALDAAKGFSKTMVSVAHAVREQSIGMSGRPDALEETLSTRVLTDWASYWPQYAGREFAVHNALRSAFTTGCEPSAAAAIHAIVTLQFGTPDRIGAGS